MEAELINTAKCPIQHIHKRGSPSLLSAQVFRNLFQHFINTARFSSVISFPPFPPPGSPLRHIFRGRFARMRQPPYAAVQGLPCAFFLPQALFPASWPSCGTSALSLPHSSPSCGAVASPGWYMAKSRYRQCGPRRPYFPSLPRPVYTSSAIFLKWQKKTAQTGHHLSHLPVFGRLPRLTKVNMRLNVGLSTSCLHCRLPAATCGRLLLPWNGKVPGCVLFKV